MNEEFIIKVLPPVPPRFAKALYDRLAADHSRASLKMFLRHLTIRERWQATAIVLTILLTAACTQIILRSRYVRIGDLFLVEISRLTELVNPGGAAPAIPTPGQLPINEYGWTVWEFSPGSPKWIPDGFSSIDIPSEMTAYEQTIGLWSNMSNERIRLYIVPQAEGMHPFAPPGEYEEVSVSGNPAILIHGRYTPTSSESPQSERPWSEDLGFQLSWPSHGSMYTLETFGTYLAQAELIRMAESVAPPERPFSQ
jgi:hypothetical protein